MLISKGAGSFKWNFRWFEHLPFFGHGHGASVWVLAGGPGGWCLGVNEILIGGIRC